MSDKVFIVRANEDWIIDRFASEFDEDNDSIVVDNPRDADVIWILADFCWNHLPVELLSSKKVITTIHHIVPEKFNQRELLEFQTRDNITTVYHVPNKYTEAFIRPLTQKPIHVISYWANQKIWKITGTKENLRKKFFERDSNSPPIPLDAYVIGSFQRDTEGTGISQGLFKPKLEKGPDLLIDFICNEIKTQKHKDIVLLLAGWRRNYLITELQKSLMQFMNVSDEQTRFYSSQSTTTFWLQYPESVIEAKAANQVISQHIINELYQTLDLYPVTARYEGGPQSLIECGLLSIPVVSRSVGIAEQVLPASAINDNVALATPAVPNVTNLLLPDGYQPYRNLIESL